MKKTAPVRFFEPDSYVTIGTEALNTHLAAARSNVGKPIKYALIDPFAQTISEIGLDATLLAKLGGTAVYVHAREQQFKDLLGCKQIVTQPFMENKINGMYSSVIGGVCVYS